MGTNFFLANFCREKLSVLLLIILFLTLGCSVTRREIDNNTVNFSINSEQKIIIIQPKVKFEFVDNSSPYQNDSKKILETSLWLMDEVEDIVRNKGFKSVVITRKQKQAERISRKDSLSNSSDHFVRLHLKENDVTTLQKACKNNDDVMFLFLYLKVKVGNQGGWGVQGLPPISFQLVPRAKQSTSNIRSIIRDCNKDKYYWHNEVFVRELPIIDNSIFKNSMVKLFDNLSTKNIMESNI